MYSAAVVVIFFCWRFGVAASEYAKHLDARRPWRIRDHARVRGDLRSASILIERAGTFQTEVSAAALWRELEQPLVRAALAQNPPAPTQVLGIEWEKAARLHSGSADSRNVQAAERARTRNTHRRIRLRLHSDQALHSFCWGENSPCLLDANQESFRFPSFSGEEGHDRLSPPFSRSRRTKHECSKPMGQGYIPRPIWRAKCISGA
jgi:hypothetical protein